MPCPRPRPPCNGPPIPAAAAACLVVLRWCALYLVLPLLLSVHVPAGLRRTRVGAADHPPGGEQAVHQAHEVVVHAPKGRGAESTRQHRQHRQWRLVRGPFNASSTVARNVRSEQSVNAQRDAAVLRLWNGFSR